LAHVSQFKKDVVKKVSELISTYPIVGVVDMENLPAPPLQKMKSQLRGKVEIFMTKKRLIRLAIEKIKDKKQGIEKLEPYLKGMPALIFTKDNPFSLFKTLKKSKSAAPIKAGQVTPKDIEVKAGSTGFAPGPIISELSDVGIKCGVEDGKVAIKEDSIVAKEGDTVDQNLAGILTRLGIEPMEVGLNIRAVFEDGIIYDQKVLDVDEDKFKQDLQNAATWAFNLAIEAAYPTKDTVNVLIGKAFNESKAIGLEANIIDKGIINDLMAKAEGAMQSLKQTANIEVPDKKAEAPKEEPKPEAPTKPEEKKVEEKPQTPKKEETVTEKKEEILEKEKEIIKEEQKVEKEAKEKEKTEAPVEKEVEEAVKEEVEKELETERIDQEKKLESVEQDTDAKVAEMVEKTKKMSEKKPSADDLLQETKTETPKETKKEVEKVPSAADLASNKNQNQKTAEELAQELIKKGTLRK